ncbi:MAG: hypothetical protein OEY79_04825 [Anaplasmataceae bacterium]|nr:hypothetical protein [Anaplasmataceae bacterium]
MISDDINAISRMLAVQILYSRQLSKNVDLNDLIERISCDQDSECELEYNNDLLIKLLSYNDNNEVLSRELIKKHLKPTWNIDRLDKILYINILLAIAEMSYVEKNKINKNDILNHYVTIAHMFLDEKEVRFVKSILQNIWNYLK